MARSRGEEKNRERERWRPLDTNLETPTHMVGKQGMIGTQGIPRDSKKGFIGAKKGFQEED